MNLRYLGDALDFWKGSLVTRLQSSGIIKDLAVDPMASDPDDWREEDLLLLAELLQIDRQQLIAHPRTLSTGRTAYFAELDHNGDLFLDPDTGVATGQVRNRANYVFPSELHDLIARHDQRVLMVYQHIRAQRPRDRLKTIVASLSLPDCEIACCSYESGTAALLFLSRSAGRIDAIHDYFKNLLGRHSAGRITRL
jgi:hypothetical protein